MQKLMIFAAGILVAGVLSGFGINDALVYDMALVPTEGSVPKTAIYNRLTHSAATRATATSVSTFSGSTETCGTPDPITITNANVVIPVYGNVSRTEPVLSFPQTIRQADGKIYTYRQGILFDNMPVSSNMTVYCRMRLDPSILSWKRGMSTTTEYNGCEYTLFDFEQFHGNTTTTFPRGFRLCMHTQYGMHYLVLRHGYYNSTQWGGGYVHLSNDAGGSWFDIALVIETDEAEQKTYARVYGRCNGGQFGRASCGVYSNETVHEHMKHYTIPTVCAFKSQKVSLGVSVGSTGKTAWETIAATNRIDAFRGQCSRFRIYNRPLTTEEIRGLFTEMNGGAVLAATANGSTAECAAADEAEAAAAYNPLTMPSSRMRGTLTAEHPSLAIDVPSKGSDAGLAKLLSVTPLLGSLGSGTPALDLAVNGRTLGSLRLIDGVPTRFYVRGCHIATNEEGVVRYMLTRTGDLSGSLGLDALEIAGSWGEGAHHTTTSGSDPTHTIQSSWDDPPYRKDTYIGNPIAVNYMQGGLDGIQNGGTGKVSTPTTTINFYVPEEIALHRESAYVFGFNSAERRKLGVYPLLDVYLNGTKYGETVNPYERYTTYTWTFPPGTLRAGYNSLTLSNATTSASLMTEDYYATIQVDYHRFKVKPPPCGFAIIVK